jgi:hypothetical protein
VLQAYANATGSKVHTHIVEGGQYQRTEISDPVDGEKGPPVHVEFTGRGHYRSRVSSEEFTAMLRYASDDISAHTNAVATGKIPAVLADNLLLTSMIQSASVMRDRSKKHVIVRDKDKGEVTGADAAAFAKQFLSDPDQWNDAKHADRRAIVETAFRNLFDTTIGNKTDATEALMQTLVISRVSGLYTKMTQLTDHRLCI